MKYLAILVVCVGLLSIPSESVAKGSRISDFERYKSSDRTISLTEYKLLMTRLIGAYEGIGWVNALNDKEGRPQIFCPPPDYVISTDDLRGMLDEEIRIHSFSAKPYPKNMPMEAVVMFAAINRYPCK